jgi:hypothetical protein
VTEFSVGRSAVKVWKEHGRWAVSVDGAAVGGRHMTEAQAAGAGLLQIMFASRARAVRLARRASVAGRKPR